MTIREIFNNLTSHQNGSIAFDKNCNKLLDTFTNRDEARDELLDIIDVLRPKKRLIRNGFCIVPYNRLDLDGEYHTNLALVSREDILNMHVIPEFENIRLENELAPGEIFFWNLTDAEINERISGINSLPKIHRWTSSDISTLLSAEIYNCEYIESLVLKELINRCLNAKLNGQEVWDHPLASLEVESLSNAPENIRQTHLWSFISFYQALSEVHRDILKEHLYSGDFYEPFHRYTITRNAVKCLICDDIVESRHRTEKKSCFCKCVTVEGGTDYIRRIGDPSYWIELSQFVCVDDD